MINVTRLAIDNPTPRCTDCGHIAGRNVVTIDDAVHHLCDPCMGELADLVGKWSDIAMRPDPPAETPHVHSSTTCRFDAEGPSIMWLCGHDPTFTDRAGVPSDATGTKNVVS